MSARYQNPMTSRWVSADPAIFTLVSPMDDKGNLRSGFILVESMNPYSYVGNNPLKFKDPSGLVSVVGEYDGQIVTEKNVTEPTRFDQDQFEENFGEIFSGQACAATALLNELSEEYTSITNKALTMDDAEEMMKSAFDVMVDEGVAAVEPLNAYVGSWDVAAGAMWANTGLEGEWSYDSSSRGHQIFWVNTKGGPAGDHFVNSIVLNGYFDVKTGISGNTGNLSLDPRRPTRNMSFRY